MGSNIWPLPFVLPVHAPSEAAPAPCAVTVCCPGLRACERVQVTDATESERLLGALAQVDPRADDGALLTKLLAYSTQPASKIKLQDMSYLITQVRRGAACGGGGKGGRMRRGVYASRRLLVLAARVESARG